MAGNSNYVDIRQLNPQQLTEISQQIERELIMLQG